MRAHVLPLSCVLRVRVPANAVLSARTRVTRMLMISCLPACEISLRWTSLTITVSEYGMSRLCFCSHAATKGRKNTCEGRRIAGTPAAAPGECAPVQDPGTWRV